MTIIDSGVWIDFINAVTTPQTDWMKAHFRSSRLGLADLIFCEVLQGFRDEVLFAKVKSTLLTLEIVPSGGVEIALASAQNYRFLRARGITVRTTIDCLVATVCIRGKHSLLHNDRDFHAFEKYLGLKVIHP
jgi:predicted nucleic acid-binding protein